MVIKEADEIKKKKGKPKVPKLSFLPLHSGKKSFSTPLEIYLLKKQSENAHLNTWLLTILPTTVPVFVRGGIHTLGSIEIAQIVVPTA